MSAWATNEGPVTSTKLNAKTLLVDTGANISGATTYAGQMAFCTVTGSGFTAGLLYQRNAGNSVWNVVTTQSAMRLTSDTASINGTKSTGLTLALAANTNFAFKAFLIIEMASNGSSALNFQIHALAAGAALVAAGAKCDVQSTVNDYRGAGDVTAVTTSIFKINMLNGGGATASGLCVIEGVITVGGTAATLQIDMVDAVTTDTVKAGSLLEAEIVA